MSYQNGDPSWWIRATEPDYTRNAGPMTIITEDPGDLPATKRDGSEGPTLKPKR